jgi:Ras GTPase-activating-like protein IQGAP2/3
MRVILQELASNCAAIESNCQKLVQLGILKEEDNYDRLRVDAFAELKNLEQQLNQVESDLQRLSAVLKNLHEHNHFLQQQLKAYKEYLENVRKNCGSPATAKFVDMRLFLYSFLIFIYFLAVRNPEKSAKKDKSSSKSSSSAPAPVKKTGPFKFSHKQLEADGVIMESDVPQERRSGITFSFTCSTPGIFDIAVVYKFKNITSMQVSFSFLTFF